MPERRIAEKTSFILGREDESTGSPITDRTQMVGRRYVVTSWNHDEDSEKQQSESLRAGRADVFGEDNYLWGSGDVEIEIPSESGYLDIIQGVVADPNPVSVAVPSKTLVPAATDLETIAAATYFSDTADVTVQVVDAQNLSGAANANKAIADNLGMYPQELTLTVTPDSSADLTNASTDATIVISYIDADGETQTLTLSFADAAKTTAQVVSLPAGATISRVRSTGWNAGTFDITTEIAANIVRNPELNRPGKIRVKHTGGTLTDHTMLIRGVRRVGLASNDTLPLRETIALGADVLSEKYFHRINKVEVKDASGNVVAAADLDGTVEITAEPGGYETTLKTVNDEFGGWTIEPEVGGEPWLVTKAVPIGAEIEIGENIRATVDILSNRVDKRKTIEGGDEEQFTPTAAEHPSEFPFVGRRFFSGYGRYLEIDGDAVICDAAPVSISHNYDFSQGKIPSRFRRDTEPTARRNVTSDVQTKYETGSSEEDVFIRWDEKFRNNEAVSVRIVTYQFLGNGRQLSIIYEMPNCEITSPVRVSATGPGTIPITIALKAVPPEGEIDGELRVTIVGDDQWQ